MTTEIGHDRSKIWTEGLQLTAEHIAGYAPTVQQDQGKALAGLTVGQVATIFEAEAFHGLEAALAALNPLANWA